MNATTTPVNFGSIDVKADELKKAIQRLQVFGLLVTKDNVLSNKGLAYLVAYSDISFHKIWVDHEADFAPNRAEFLQRMKDFDDNIEWFDAYFRTYMLYHIEKEMFNRSQYYAFQQFTTENERIRFNVGILIKVVLETQIPVPNIVRVLGDQFLPNAQGLTRAQLYDKLKGIKL